MQVEFIVAPSGRRLSVSEWEDVGRLTVMDSPPRVGETVWARCNYPGDVKSEFGTNAFRVTAVHYHFDEIDKPALYARVYLAARED